MLACPDLQKARTSFYFYYIQSLQSLNFAKQFLCAFVLACAHVCMLLTKCTLNKFKYVVVGIGFCGKINEEKVKVRVMFMINIIELLSNLAKF